MATIFKLRRGTTSQLSTFTGAAGEATIDTTKNTVVVHDGSTVGGFPLAKASDIVSAVTSLGFTPYNATNPAGYITGAGNAATATSATKIANTGGWNITPTGTKIFFNFNGTNVGSLDSSGNFIVSGNVTAYGAP